MNYKRVIVGAVSEDLSHVKKALGMPVKDLYVLSTDNSTLNFKWKSSPMAKYYYRIDAFKHQVSSKCRSCISARLTGVCLMH